MSPERKKLRKQAFKHLQKQAQQMIKRAHLKGGSINVGGIVQIRVSAVDLAKTDCKNLALMAVEDRTFKENPPLCRLTNKLFQLKNLYGPGSITVVKDVDPKLANLDGVLTSYQGLPKVNERAAARKMPLAGGQGIRRCNCKGVCLTKHCSCFMVGRKCTP